MEVDELITWMEKQKLLELSKKYATILAGVLKKCLNPDNNLPLVIVGDFGDTNRNISAIMSMAYYLAAKTLELQPELIFQTPKKRGESAEAHVSAKLASLKKKSVIMLNLSNRLGALDQGISNYRNYSRQKQLRFSSSPTLQQLENHQLQHLINALNIDYTKLRVSHTIIKAQISNGAEMIIRTRAGTHLVIDIRDAKPLSNEGYYLDPGTGGNLPAGEVYFAPSKNTYGKVVIDASSRNIENTYVIKEAITLEIEDGEIIRIEDSSEDKLLEKSLAWAEKRSSFPHHVRRLGEIGIGTNPLAEIIGCTLIDEKVLGTAHVAIGSNYWFGGDNHANIHLDQVFRDAVITIDGKELTF